MRTKTLILSAVASLIACVAAHADTNVYSLNAVGYINVTIPAGKFSMIANQLNTTNNSVKALLPNLDGTYDGITVYKWNGTVWKDDTGDSAFGTDGWANGGLFTMNPGEAIFFNNSRPTNMVITFFGEVLQGSLTNTLPAGFMPRSSIVPQAGGISATLGLNNTGALDGDSIYVWDPAASHYVTYTADSAFGDNGWSPEPQIQVGQGFFYQAAAQRQWVRTFSANN